MGLSKDLLARFADALDRNTKVLELVADHMIRGGPGATMPVPSMPSSTVQDAGDETSGDETAPTTRNLKQTKRFKGRPRSMSHHKTADELKYRVSFISKNESVI